MEKSQDLGHVVYEAQKSVHSRNQPTSHRLGVFNITLGFASIIANMIMCWAHTSLWFFGHGFWGGALVVIGGSLWIRYGTRSAIHTNKLPLLSVFMLLTIQVGLFLIGLAVVDIWVCIFQNEWCSQYLGIFGDVLLGTAGVCDVIVGVMSLVKCTRGPHVIADAETRTKKSLYTTLRDEDTEKEGHFVRSIHSPLP